MRPGAVTIADAIPAHFAAVIAIEREAGGQSLVALTEGHALQEALNRGHWLAVALEGDAVVGWIWFTVELTGGENVGRIFRVAVSRERHRRGVGRALVEHARDVLRERHCTRVRLTIDGGDEGARAFFAATGFALDAIAMESPL